MKTLAGLELFAQHSTLFTEYLYDDYPEILRCLRAWNAHDNYDVKKIAQRAYDTFLLGVSFAEGKSFLLYCEFLFRLQML